MTEDVPNRSKRMKTLGVLFLEGKKGIAKSVYDRFCKEYRESLGEDYKIPLSKLCE